MRDSKILEKRHAILIKVEVPGATLGQIWDNQSVVASKLKIEPTLLTKRHLPTKKRGYPSYPLNLINC